MISTFNHLISITKTFDIFHFRFAAFWSPALDFWRVFNFHLWHLFLLLYFRRFKASQFLSRFWWEQSLRRIYILNFSKGFLCPYFKLRNRLKYFLSTYLLSWIFFGIIFWSGYNRSRFIIFFKLFVKCELGLMGLMDFFALNIIAEAHITWLKLHHGHCFFMSSILVDSICRLSLSFFFSLWMRIIGLIVWLLSTLVDYVNNDNE